MHFCYKLVYYILKLLYEERYHFGQRERKENTMEKQWKELLDGLNKLAENLDMDSLQNLLNAQNSGLLEKVDGQELQGMLDELKKFVSQRDLQPFYSTLKKLGFQTEMKLNEQIQGSLNKRELVKMLHANAHIIAPILNRLQELVELLSGPLNLPTKNDVANVARLTIQNEEKLDSIEEQLLILNEHLRLLLSEDVPTFKKKKNERVNRLEQKELKKLKLFNYVLQSTSNQLQRKE